MRNWILILLVLTLVSCKTPTEKWLNGLADYGQVRGTALGIEVIKLNTRKDSSVLNYKLRLQLDKKWVEANPQANTAQLNYRVDSCFFIMAGADKCYPAMVQPVADGIKNSYEYLISFNMDNKLKMKSLRMVYADKYTDGHTYTLDLDKH